MSTRLITKGPGGAIVEAAGGVRAASAADARGQARLQGLRGASSVQTVWRRKGGGQLHEGRVGPRWEERDPRKLQGVPGVESGNESVLCLPEEVFHTNLSTHYL